MNIKISGNELLWKLLEHPSYVQALKQDKPHLDISTELIKKIYGNLVQSQKYQQYINEQSRNRKDEKDILEFILTDLMLPNESFTGFIEERFPNWDDDADMVNQLVTAILAKPASLNLQELISPDKMLFIMQELILSWRR